ncbi:hypothetical protein [Eikenella sp. Marseille-P7795]|uniref:hypothetical protein n=1 Tax=Eikenella sp. Marseille-P7795 TaxID=2866577 RepID=UPI001CE45ADE|nr:hypothetical protein [Eikenella sp. Marseille-P7795]
MKPSRLFPLLALAALFASHTAQADPANERMRREADRQLQERIGHCLQIYGNQNCIPAAQQPAEPRRPPDPRSILSPAERRALEEQYRRNNPSGCTPPDANGAQTCFSLTQGERASISLQNRRGEMHGPRLNYRYIPQNQRYQIQERYSFILSNSGHCEFASVRPDLLADSTRISCAEAFRRLGIGQN